MDDLIKRILLRAETEGQAQLESLVDVLRRADQAAGSLQSRFPLNVGGGSSAGGVASSAETLAASYAPVSAGELQSVLTQFVGDIRGLLDTLRSAATTARAYGAVPTAGINPSSAAGYSPALAAEVILPSDPAPLPFAAPVTVGGPVVPSAVSGAFAQGGIAPGYMGNLSNLLTRLQSRGDNVSMLEHRLRDELENIMSHGQLAQSVLSGQGEGIAMSPSAAGGLQDWIGALNERLGVLSSASGSLSGGAGLADLQRVQGMLSRSSALGRRARGEFSLLSTYEPGALQDLPSVGGAGTPFEHLETYLGRMQSATAAGVEEAVTARREALRAEYESGDSAQRLSDQLDRLTEATSRYHQMLESVSSSPLSGSYADISRTAGVRQAEERRLRNDMMQELAGVGDVHSTIIAAYGGVLSPEERAQFSGSRARLREDARGFARQGSSLLGESATALAEARAQQQQQQEELRQVAADDAQRSRMLSFASAALGFGAGQALQWYGRYESAALMGAEPALGTGGRLQAELQGGLGGMSAGLTAAGTVGSLVGLGMGSGPLGIATGLALSPLALMLGKVYGEDIAQKQWIAGGAPAYRDFLSQFGTLNMLTSGTLPSGDMAGREFLTGMTGASSADILSAVMRGGAYPAVGERFGFGPGSYMRSLEGVTRTYGYGPFEGGRPEAMTGELLAWSRILATSPDSLMPAVELARRQGMSNLSPMLGALESYGSAMGGGLGMARFGETLGLGTSISGFLTRFAPTPDIRGILGYMGGWEGRPDAGILGGNTGFSNIVAPVLQAGTDQSMSFRRAMLFQAASRDAGGALSLADFARLQTDPARFGDLLKYMRGMAEGIGEGTGQGGAFGAHLLTGMSMPYADIFMGHDDAKAQSLLQRLQASTSMSTVAGRAAAAIPPGAAMQATEEITQLAKSGEIVESAWKNSATFQHWSSMISESGTKFISMVEEAGRAFRGQVLGEGRITNWSLVPSTPSSGSGIPNVFGPNVGQVNARP